MNKADLRILCPAMENITADAVVQDYRPPVVHLSVH